MRIECEINAHSVPIADAPLYTHMNFMIHCILPVYVYELGMCILSDHL